MNPIALIGGAGLMGRVTARDLVESGRSVVIADINIDGARRLAEQLGPSASARAVDAGDVRSILAAIEGCAAVINVSQYYFNLTVMEACLEAGLPYCDLGGLYHTTLRQLELDAAFKARGLLAILAIGSASGVTNVMGRYGAERLAQVDAIRCYDAYWPPEEGLRWSYSLNTIFDEITSRPMVWRDRTMIEVEPLSEVEDFFFDHGIGLQQVHHSLHSEVNTLPFTWPEKRVREVYFKIAYFGYTPEALGRLKLFADAGLASRETMEVPGSTGEVATIRPRDVLIRSLERHASQAEDDDGARDRMGVEEVVTVITGLDAGGGSVEYRIGTAAWYHEAWGEGAGAVLTGVPPSIAGQWLADGRLEVTGVVGPEAVLDPEPFLAELARRGMRSTVQVKQPLPAR
jgi:lysine 6-dehydrogenase